MGTMGRGGHLTYNNQNPEVSKMLIEGVCAKLGASAVLYSKCLLIFSDIALPKVTVRSPSCYILVSRDFHVYTFIVHKLTKTSHFSNTVIHVHFFSQFCQTFYTFKRHQQSSTVASKNLLKINVVLCASTYNATLKTSQ